MRRDARSHLIEISVAMVVLKNLVDEIFALRTRSDKRHLTLQHIPQLRQLVEVMGTQESACLRHTRLVFVLVERGTVFLGIDAHRTELVDVERTTETPYSLLLENGRATILAAHGDVANQEQRRENDDAKQRDKKVEEPLGVALQLVHPVQYVSVFECRHDWFLIRYLFFKNAHIAVLLHRMQKYIEKVHFLMKMLSNILMGYLNAMKK